MDLNGLAALSSFSYQGALAQTGNTSQALTQAFTSSQTQVSEASSLLASSAPLEPLFGLGGSSGLDFALLGGSSPSALLPSSDSLPSSTAYLTPSTTAALVRYAYDSNQDPSTAVQNALASTQASMFQAGLDLLA